MYIDIYAYVCISYLRSLFAPLTNPVGLWAPAKEGAEGGQGRHATPGLQEGLLRAKGLGLLLKGIRGFLLKGIRGLL